MPLYLDRHDVLGATPNDLAVAHVKDLELQDRYGVRYLTYWFDAETGGTFCLARGPNVDAVNAVHRESHGLVATKIIEVDMRGIEQFLGGVTERPPGEPYTDTAFRTILFTDIEGSTNFTQRVGDIKAMEMIRSHDRIVRDGVETNGGHVVKHTGDGLMASFVSVAQAIQSAIVIKRKLAEYNARSDEPINVRIGLAAGEPVTENDDLFGAAVQQAARLCSEATVESIFVSGAVHDLAIGKGFHFKGHGELVLKGFDEPTRVFEVHWDF